MPPPARTAHARTPAPRTRIRWDKLGRRGMLVILAVLLYLAIAPALHLLSTEHEASHQRAQLAALEHANAALRARRAELSKNSEIEAEARTLGMVQPGERAYVVNGLPSN